MQVLFMLELHEVLDNHFKGHFRASLLKALENLFVLVQDCNGIFAFYE